MEIDETDLSTWTDAEIIHVCESSGVSWKIFGAIKYPKDVELDDEDFDDWKRPEYAAVRRAALESYLYGMHMSDLSCKKWHKHCRGAY